MGEAAAGPAVDRTLVMASGPAGPGAGAPAAAATTPGPRDAFELAPARPRAAPSVLATVFASPSPSAFAAGAAAPDGAAAPSVLATLFAAPAVLAFAPAAGPAFAGAGVRPGGGGSSSRDAGRHVAPSSPRPAAPDEPRRAPPVEAGKRAEAAGPAVKTDFERFEVKFWVTERQADRVIEFARPYLERDAHGRDRALPRNVSLYLDTRGFLFYELHVNGAPDRCKLRVRGYGDPPSGMAFFETKRKVKTVSLKGRVNLPMALVAEVLGGRIEKAIAACASKDRRNLDNFFYLQTVHRAEPSVLIASYREPFMSKTPGEDVRMTIDREIAYQPARGYDLAGRPGAWTSLRGPDRRSFHGKGRALIELKFRGAAPAWMGEVVARFGLRREAFSKYASAVAHLKGVGPR